VLTLADKQRYKATSNNIVLHPNLHFEKLYQSITNLYSDISALDNYDFACVIPWNKKEHKKNLRHYHKPFTSFKMGAMITQELNEQNPPIDWLIGMAKRGFLGSETQEQLKKTPLEEIETEEFQEKLRNIYIQELYYDVAPLGLYAEVPLQVKGVRGDMPPELYGLKMVDSFNLYYVVQPVHTNSAYSINVLVDRHRRFVVDGEQKVQAYLARHEQIKQNAWNTEFYHLTHPFQGGRVSGG
jgi:hypothetical protein